MDFISYFLSVIIAYSGILFGLLLGKIAKEELKPGKRFFLLMQNILFIMFLVLFLFFFLNNKILIIMGILIIIIIIFKSIKQNFGVILKKSINPYYVYIIYGILIFLVQIKLNEFFVLLTIIFVYGLPTGSLVYYSKKDILKQVLSKTVFLGIAAVVFLMFKGL